MIREVHTPYYIVSNKEAVMYLCFLGGLVSIEKNTQDNIITLNRVIEILNKNDVI